MTARTIAVAAAVVICCVARDRAQVAAGPSLIIEWSADRALAIKDFKAKVPPRATDASLSFVSIEASWECEGGAGSWRASAVFDPSRSWWREINQNIWQGSDDRPMLAPRDDAGRSLLAHEQLHFDLTELWVRKIRGLFKTLPAACKTPGASRTLEATVGDLEHKWQDEQKTYDKETSHGIDSARQAAWAKKTARALNETPRN